MNTPRILVILLLTVGIVRAQAPAETLAQPPAPNPTAPAGKQDAVAEIGKLQAAYNTAMEANAAENAKWTEGLEKWYLDGLDKLQAERAKAGDLDGALLVKAERERIATHMETTAEQIQAMPAALRKLRGTYEGSLKKIAEEVAKRNLPVSRKLLADLDALQKRTTVSGDLEQALIVKQERERLAAQLAASVPAPMSPQKTVSVTPAVKPGPSAPAIAATKERPFVNSLGMKFATVPGTKVMFCIWDTRVKDYAAYARVNKVDDSWKKQEKDGVPVSRAPEYPVVGVSWDDANAFCKWLTKRETAEGKLPKGAKYRLPTDEEWSIAAGLPPEEGATPAEKSGKNSVDFPWGKEWPPTGKVGNYADEVYHAKFPKEKSLLEGYNDGYATTSPVGSFPANAYGLYDMGGNVWQWCEDSYDASQKDRVLRGASWRYIDRDKLLLSHRGLCAPAARDSYCGFRCVVASSAP